MNSLSVITKDRSLISQYTNQRHLGNMKLRAEADFAEQAMQNNNYLAKVMTSEAGIQSVKLALLDGARLGLSLSPARREGYLIPYKINNVVQATFCPSYIGFEQEVLRSGVVTSIQTHLFYANDVMRHFTDDDGDHIQFERSRGKRGEFQGVFCQAKYPNGDRHVEIMYVKDLDACQAAAKRKNGDNESPAWKFFKEEMQKKCCVRRGAKHWPHHDRLEQIEAAMQRQDPMDFGDESKVMPAPQYLSLSDLDIEALEAFMEGEGVPHGELTDQLNMVSQVMGFPGGIANLPVDKIPELKDRIMARQEKLRLLREKNQ